MSELEKETWEEKVKLIGLMTLIARYCLVGPIKAPSKKTENESDNDIDDSSENDSDDDSDEGDEEEEDSHEKATPAPFDPTTSCSISILLSQFTSLRTSLCALHCLHSLDFYCDYMYRKVKDNKLPE